MAEFVVEGGAAVARLESVVRELKEHPGIRVIKAEVLPPTAPEVIAAAKARCGGAFPLQGIEGFYGACGGVEVEWQAAESRTRNYGKICIPGISRLFREAAPESWARLDARDVAIRPEGIRIGGDVVGVGVLEYIELAAAARGFANWPDLLVPGGRAAAAGRSSVKTVVARYLFADFDPVRFDLTRRERRSSPINT